MKSTFVECIVTVYHLNVVTLWPLFVFFIRKISRRTGATIFFAILTHIFTQVCQFSKAFSRLLRNSFLKGFQSLYDTCGSKVDAGCKYFLIFKMDLGG